jgi:pimeloyl-ACP methyl ester carboxylesterase
MNSPAKANSFDAMDRILELLSDKSRFPNLKSIVLVGHSGGGQFMQRYAAANQMEAKLRVPVRYVVANPSSYLYLNDARLRTDANCTPDGKCTGPFGPYWDRINCTGYNRYRYGLDSPVGYVASVGANTIRRQYPSRNVTYLIGDLDQLQDSDLDKSCAAQAQGFNRRERGINFWNYMRSQYQATGHKLVLVPRCGHNAACMFASSTGSKVLFP